MLIGALMLGICAPAQAAYNMPYYIGVDLTNQIVTVYNTADNTIARQMLCSSGKNDSTVEGTFYMPDKGRASERTEWTWYDPYNAWVKFSTRIWHGYMFHSLPFHRKDESTLDKQAARELGTPASHGCMRLRVDDARFIAKKCLKGTMVRIYKEKEKQEDLRQLLLISSYTGEDGMSYTEFLGYSEDALGRGSGGTEVKDIQARLTDLGYFDGEVSGRYDADTVAAVKHVQQDLGLAQSGVTSAELAQLLYSEDAPISTGQITLKEGRSGPVVKRLQSALSEIGVYDGELDSVYDLEVADAVRLFQGACNYKVNGVASPEVQQALYYQLGKLEEIFGEGGVPAAEIETEEVLMATLNASTNIIVRSQPSTEASSIGKLRNGDTMFVDGTQGDWAQVSAGGGSSASGYVMKKYLDPFKQNNVVLSYTDANGNRYTIGHTMAEYREGAESFADEFSAYIASEQYAAETSAEQVRYATVATGSDDVKLNLRSSASSDGEILAEVPNGTSMRVLGEADGWTQVGYGEKIGYLMNDYLTFWEGRADEVEVVEDPSEYEMPDEVKAVVICKGKKSAPVYDSGSADAKRLGSLTEGTKVDVISLGESGDDWVCIRYKGRKGYMLDANLQFQLM